MSTGIPIYVFCIICSLLMCVVDASGDTMEAYSSVGLVIASYVTSIGSFCFPHVEVSDFGICIVLCVFVVVLSM